jgi:hypothetical protein
MSRVAPACVAFALAAATIAQQSGYAGTGPLAADLLRQAAAMQAGDAAAWADLERRVQQAYADWAQRYRGWRNHRPPPRPDLAPLALPVPFLAADWLAMARTGGRPSRYYEVLEALAQSPDPRAQEFLLEQYDQRGSEMHRGSISRSLAPALASERAAAVVAVQLQLAPRVSARELPFLLLQRCGGELSHELRRAGRDWLATFPTGPANGDAEHVWKLRFELGDAGDRDALIPHLLGANDLAYCLWTIQHAPMPHARLADALRTRRARMSEHERGSLTEMIASVLAVTDPAEVAAFLARVDELWPRVAAATATTDEQSEFHRRVMVLADMDAPRARAVVGRYVRDEGVDGVQRCAALAQLIRRRGQAVAELREWWLQNVPPGLQRLLENQLRPPR